jgi:phage host-nuclease inhibitor protein Gam
MTIKTINGIADLESAMNEMQIIDAKMRGEYAMLSDRIAKDRESVNEKLSGDVNRHAELAAMIEQYAFKFKGDLFSAEKKSLKLNAGTISLRLGPMSIKLKKGSKTEKVLEAAKRLKLAIIRNPAPELDKDAVKELIETGEIDQNVLGDLGLVAEQSETITIKLND